MSYVFPFSFDYLKSIFYTDRAVVSYIDGKLVIWNVKWNKKPLALGHLPPKQSNNFFPPEFYVDIRFPAECINSLSIEALREMIISRFAESLSDKLQTHYKSENHDTSKVNRDVYLYWRDDFGLPVIKDDYAYINPLASAVFLDENLTEPVIYEREPTLNWNQPS